MVYLALGVFTLASIIMFRSIHFLYINTEFLQTAWNKVFDWINTNSLEKLPLLSISMPLFLGCTLLIQQSKNSLHEQWNPYSIESLGISEKAVLPTLWLITGIFYSTAVGTHRFALILVLGLFTFQMSMLLYFHLLSETHMRNQILQHYERSIENYDIIIKEMKDYSKEKERYQNVEQLKGTERKKALKILKNIDRLDRIKRSSVFDNIYKSMNRLLTHSYFKAGSIDINDSIQNVIDIIDVQFDRFYSQVEGQAHLGEVVERYALIIGIAIMPISSMNNSHRITQQDYFDAVFNAICNKINTFITVSTSRGASENQQIKSKCYVCYLYYILNTFLARYMFSQNNPDGADNQWTKDFLDKIPKDKAYSLYVKAIEEAFKKITENMNLNSSEKAELLEIETRKILGWLVKEAKTAMKDIVTSDFEDIFDYLHSNHQYRYAKKVYVGTNKN